ncbi:MAG: ABC transporter permease [Bacteroidales bacterium]|nr:ABC transporter permease [Bacteroidales bacterium]
MQVFRNSLLWKILILAPLAEFLLFPYTADYEIKNVKVVFVDHDRSTMTTDILSTFSASKYFINEGVVESRQEAEALMRADKVDFIVEFPADFEKSLVRQEPVKVHITANAINTVKAGLGSEYVQTVLGNYFMTMAESTPKVSPISADTEYDMDVFSELETASVSSLALQSGEGQDMQKMQLQLSERMQRAQRDQELMERQAEKAEQAERAKQAEVAARAMNPQLAQLVTTNVYWFNEQMNYKNLIVPGLLIILVTLIGAYVTALNIVREKELGTIEQVNVTPIKKWQFLLGKMIPFLILGLVEFGAGLLIMNLLFGIHIQGSLLLVFGLTTVYLLVMLGLGFFISSMASNQLQAMFIVFFLFILFVMLSGILTPVEGMPQWASYLNYANPMSFFMSAMKTVILKGSTVDNIRTQFIVLAVMAVVLNAAALISYRETAK